MNVYRNCVARVRRAGLIAVPLSALGLLLAPVSAHASWDDFKRSAENALGTVITEANEIIQEGRNDQLVRLVNRSQVPRIMIWRALGCAGIKEGEITVCHSEEVAAGASAEYTFKKGTSKRVIVAHDPSDKSKSGSACHARFTEVFEAKEGEDVEIPVQCHSVNKGAITMLGSKAYRHDSKDTENRDYILNVRSMHPEIVSVVVISPRCSMVVRGLKNVCREMMVMPKSASQIPIQKAFKPNTAYVGYSSTKDHAIVPLRGLNNVEIGVGSVVVR